MSSIGSYFAPASSLTVQENIAALPHYDTDMGEDLPPNAAPMGVLADGEIYSKSYSMLTPGDVSFLQQATGQSFDPATIAAEQAAGTFKGNPLAAAIGFDRANYILGLGGFSGNISTSYLQSIESAISNPQGDGTYEGFQITQNELSAAFSALAEQPQSGANVSVTA